MSINASARPDPAGAADPSRRQVLCGLVVALLAPGAMAAACSDGDGDSAPATPGGRYSPGTQSTPPASGGQLASVSDVPVGGGVLVDGPDGKLLLVQPTGGEIKAYDPTCTHQGTTVNPPEGGGVITCPNHGSQYDPADGSVVKSPAERPLTEVPVSVDGDSILLA